MTDVMEAYDKLVAIARQGREFRHDQVFHSPASNLAADVFGSGFDFESAVAVPDITTRQTIQAQVALRVIATVRETLFLRSRATWTPSGGKEYRFTAVYDIPRDAARLLARNNEQEPEADEGKRIWGTWLAAVQAAAECNAAWTYGIPGFDDSEPGLSVEEMNRRSSYFSNVLQGLSETNLKVTCMLDHPDFEEVHPEELIKLYEWVSAQPEIAKLA